MTLRFLRRVRIAPGLRVNLSKSGASLSVGRKGMWLTSAPTNGEARRPTSIGTKSRRARFWVNSRA
jgi:hypothetical protein